MDKLLGTIQHYGNSIHVYSRLCSILDASSAYRIACLYERCIHPLLYGKGASYFRKREAESGISTLRQAI